MSKRKKLRVAFRKNRQKRKRDNKLTRRLLDDALDDEPSTGGRLTGKGELSRHRTVVGVETAEGDFQLEVDESQCLRGRVLSATGLNCRVESEDGDEYECTVRRVVRTMARDARNAVVAGDHVLFQPVGEDDQGVIERVEPRRGVLSRQTQRSEHVIVANVDQALIVVSAVDPPLKPGLVDRFLISSERGDIASIICINKVDLADRVALQPLVGLYAGLGYQVVCTSAARGWGIDALRRILRGRETVVSGQSGVGKSSLLNRVQPGLSLSTGEISDWTRKGRHTTRRAELVRLDDGGWVVDTPGIRQMSLWDVLPEEVEAYFREFRPFVAHCKFPDCTHTHESECAVKLAVSRQMISHQRYDSYLRIVSGDFE